MFRTTYKKLAAATCAALLMIGAAWAEDAPDDLTIFDLESGCDVIDFHTAYGHAGSSGDASISLSGTVTCEDLVAADGEVEMFTKQTDDYQGGANFKFTWGDDDAVRDLSGATGVKITYTLTGTALKFLLVADNEDVYSNYNFYGVDLPINADETTLEFEWTDFAQEDWGASTGAVDIADVLANSMGLQFELKDPGELEDGDTPEEFEAVLTIISIEWLGGKPGADDGDDCEGDECGTDDTPEHKLISDFATDHQSEFGTWWFAMDFEYNGEGEAEVEVEDGVAFVVNGESADEDGRRTTLALEFNNPKAPFDGSEFAGISFFYKTTGTTPVTFKVVDTDLENGEDFGFTLQPVDSLTEVFITFDELELPSWVDDENREFNPENIISIQFVIKGAEGDTFFIDDVWFRVAGYQSVAEVVREVPPTVSEEIVVVAPVVIKGGEFTAGPNPASRSASETVKFFWTGRALTGGNVAVYDAQGNIVKRLAVVNGNVEPWNLTDARGRAVAEGTYLIRGVLNTTNGRERVSALIGVTK